MTPPGGETIPPTAHPLSIAFVIARYPPALGGTEAQALALATELGRAGHGVTVFTQRLPGPGGPARPGVRRLPPQVGGRLASGLFGLRLLPALAGLQPHVIQAFLLSSPALFAGLAGRLLGCPVVIKLGGSGRYSDLSTSGERWISRLRLRRVLSLADHVVAPSRTAREELLAAGFPAGRCTVIANGVDLAGFGPGADPGDPEACRTVIFAGRLEPEKDAQTLLRAWSLAGAARPRARLLILGEGSLRPGLEGLARELGVAGSVTFAGAVSRDEMPAWYRRGGVFALPSRSEGISNALLEALAAGLAPVLSDIPGNREAVPGPEGALFFTPGDAPGLAARLGSLLDDAELRERLGRAALARAAAFSIGRTAAEYLDLYRRLLAARAAAGRGQGRGK